jgi:methylase of polypeptide subunit release factors
MLEFFPEVFGKHVLDFGTGCGVLAVAASLLGAAGVVACDVAPEALLLTRENARTFESTNIVTQLVDRRDPRADIENSKFDIIICNPASLPVRFENAVFFSGGKVGLSMINPMIDVASSLLATDGRLVFLHTSLAPLHQSLSRLAKNGFSAAITHVRTLPFRPHYQELQHYFSILRSRGQIFYDVDEDGRAYELLYLIGARRFATQERGDRKR